MIENPNIRLEVTLWVFFFFHFFLDLTVYFTESYTLT